MKHLESGERGKAEEVFAQIRALGDRRHPDGRHPIGPITSGLLAGIRLPPNYGEAYNSIFTGIYSEVAGKYDISLVPQLMYQVAEKSELMQEDGIHPTAEAQPQLVNEFSLDDAEEAMRQLPATVRRPATRRHWATLQAVAQ